MADSFGNVSNFRAVNKFFPNLTNNGAGAGGGGGMGGPAGGDLTGFYPNPSLVTTGVVAGTYGNGSNIPQITVDAKGRALNIVTLPVSLPSGLPPVGPAGGDLTGTYPNPSLVASGVVAGSYGNALSVPQVTVDSKGRLTAVANVAISGVPPGGPAGGVLSGTYPNPGFANPLVMDGTRAGIQWMESTSGAVWLGNSASTYLMGTDFLSAVVGNDNDQQASASIFGNSNFVDTDAAESTALGFFNSVEGGTRGLVAGYGNFAQASCVAIGENSTALINRAIGIGYFAQASRPSSIAIGTQARAVRDDTVSIGNGAYCAEPSAVAVGQNAFATSLNSIAIGLNTQASLGSNQLCIGDSAIAQGQSSVSMGHQTNVSGNFSVGVGRNVTVPSVNSVYVGADGSANFEQSILIGYQNGSTDVRSIGIGTGCSPGLESICMGVNVIANNSSIAIGANTQANSLASVAIGKDATCGSSDSCVAIGYQANASANAQTVAIGFFAQALKSETISIGGNSVCDAEQSVTIGFGAQCTNSAKQVCIGHNAISGAKFGTVIGGDASDQGADGCTLVGYQAVTNAFAEATVVGAGAQSNCTRGLALGRNANCGDIAGGSGPIAIVAGDGGNDPVTIEAVGAATATLIVMINGVRYKIMMNPF